jgi:hypothetical protein
MQIYDQENGGNSGLRAMGKGMIVSLPKTQKKWIM